MGRHRRVSACTGAIMMMVLAVGLAACGDDGPKTLSEDDFVAEVDDICGTAMDALEDLDGASNDYFDDVTDLIDEAVEDLTPLKPPKALQADFDEFLANLDDQATETIRAAKAVRAGEDLTGAADELTSLAADSDELTSSLGVSGCFGEDAVQVIPTLSQDDLIEQMNSVCAQADTDIEDLTFTESDEYFGDIADIFQSVVDGLEGLAPPPAVQEDFTGFVESMRALAEEVRTVAESGSFDFDPVDAATDRSRDHAAAIGADECVTLLGEDGDLES